MNDYIEKIYRLLNSPIITPYNLLENAKLENYEYVKYSKGKKGLVTEMKCLVDDLETVFKYMFDENDYLEKIYMKQGNNKKIVFDRKSELKEVRKNCIQAYINNVNDNAM